jgi:hypothetical protein
LRTTLRLFASATVSAGYRSFSAPGSVVPRDPAVGGGLPHHFRRRLHRLNRQWMATA